MIKKLLLLVLCLGYGMLNAQFYERGKKNFFIEAGAAYNFSNAHKGAFTGNETGLSYGLAGGKLFHDIFRIGAVYQYHTQHYAWRALFPMDFTRHYIGLRADMMLPLFNVYLGKSNKYECTVLDNRILLGAEYGLNMGGTSASQPKTEFLLDLAYAIRIKKSGSTKKQAAFDFFVLLNMKKALTPYVKIPMDGQNIYGTYWGVSLMLVKYRTGKWM